MAEIKKQTGPEQPKNPAEGSTPELQGKKDEHHHHVRTHHDHVISPPSTGTSYLNPGSVTIRR